MEFGGPARQPAVELGRLSILIVVLAKARTHYPNPKSRRALVAHQSSPNFTLWLWIPGRASLARDDSGVVAALELMNRCPQ